MKNDSEQNAAWLLLQSSIPAKVAFAKVAEQFNLTYMQLLTLCLIKSCQDGPVLQRVTSALGCDASNVTGLVDKLVNQGFLERSESPLDRRAKIVTLTPKGMHTQRETMHSFANSSFLNVLTEQEIENLASILSKLHAQNTAP